MVEVVIVIVDEQHDNVVVVDDTVIVVIVVVVVVVVSIIVTFPCLMFLLFFSLFLSFSSLFLYFLHFSSLSFTHPFPPPPSHVFRSWGRVGAPKVGGTKLDPFSHPSPAIAHFESLFYEKTGNTWPNRSHDLFIKKPKFFQPIELDYGQDQIDHVTKVKPGEKSKLSVSIQELIKTIFDVDMMKRAMIEMEIDLNRMPLGKLSKGQISRAYGILTEVQGMIEGGEARVSKFTEGTLKGRKGKKEEEGKEKML